MAHSRQMSAKSNSRVDDNSQNWNLGTLGALQAALRSRSLLRSLTALYSLVEEETCASSLFQGLPETHSLLSS